MIPQHTRNVLQEKLSSSVNEIANCLGTQSDLSRIVLLNVYPQIYRKTLLTER